MYQSKLKCTHFKLIHRAKLNDRYNVLSFDWKQEEFLSAFGL
jgi:hypothetical protein